MYPTFLLCFTLKKFNIPDFKKHFSENGKEFERNSHAYVVCVCVCNSEFGAFVTFNMLA